MLDDLGWTVALPVALAVCLVVMAITAAVSRVVGRVAVVDVAWGLVFVAVAAVLCALSGRPLSGLVLALVTLWGARLAGHIGRRSWGKGEDPRYEELLAGGGFGTAVRKVFLVQGVVAFVICLPLVAAATSEVRWWWVVALGVVVFAVGLAFEAVGDAQLEAYRARPREDRPPVLDTGLWGWTRHPNYFGDACVWWGLWLAGGLATGPGPALATVAGPVAMTYFIRNVSGAKLLERTMSQREGWAEYAARVPLFVPRPPNR